MRALVFLAVLALSAPAAAAPTEAFSSVDAEGRFEVEVATGPRHAVEIAGPDAGRIEMRVHNGRLRLRHAGFTMFGSPKVDAVVRVTSPALNEIEAARGMRVQGAAAGGDLRLSASQGAVVKVEAGERGRLQANASMGGIVEVTGSCRTLEARASMGGIVEAEALACTEVRAEASMGGMVEAKASESGEGSASMGGSVDIAGAPEKRSGRASMGGGVRFP